jgi:NlpC/P60 family protein
MQIRALMEGKTRKQRRLPLWFGVTLLTVAVCLFPIKTGITREAEVVAIAGLWLWWLIATWRMKWVRWALFAMLFLPLWLAFAPAKAFDSAAVRENYLGSLKGYTGAKYVWGGENSLGIDCSGLIREGMVDANWHKGLATLNPGLLRESFFVWWHDCSAKELGEGYGGRTRALFKADAINNITDPQLQPGDIAVTEGGAHVLAYLGDRTWIEADPGPMKVVQVRAGDSDNEWLRVPVTVLRWSALDGR